MRPLSLTELDSIITTVSHPSLERRLSAMARDVEAAFLLALPLLGLPTRATGSCRLAVKIEEGGKGTLAGGRLSAQREAGELQEFTLSTRAQLDGCTDPSFLVCGHK